MTPVKDLSPFFNDRCWMCLLLARQAHIGVILRRGPTEWWRTSLWNTKRDAFEGGQWFRGRIYPEKCDVSPNGKLLIYFCGKWKSRNIEAGYGATWTAVSRPPYFTALTLWPMGSTWGGHGAFVDDQTVAVVGSSGGFPATHPDHPLGPLKQLDGYPERMRSSWDHGWQRAKPASVRISASVKSIRPYAGPGRVRLQSIAKPQDVRTPPLDRIPGSYRQLRGSLGGPGSKRAAGCDCRRTCSGRTARQEKRAAMARVGESEQRQTFQNGSARLGQALGRWRDVIVWCSCALQSSSAFGYWRS
jgi:hypothetical protein